MDVGASRFALIYNFRGRSCELCLQRDGSIRDGASKVGKSASSWIPASVSGDIHHTLRPAGSL